MSYKIAVIDEETKRFLESYGEIELGDTDLTKFGGDILSFVEGTMRIEERRKKEEKKIFSMKGK